MNEKDPFIVMAEIFKRLPYAKTLEDYEELTGLLLKNGILEASKGSREHMTSQSDKGAYEFRVPPLN